MGLKSVIGRIGSVVLSVGAMAIVLGVSFKKPGQVVTVDMEFVEGMKFSKNIFSAKAGQKMVINLKNAEEHAHNMVVGKPGTLEKIGAMADSLIKVQDAWRTGWVPNTPDVIASSPLLNDGEDYVLEFMVPNVTGDYPFTCTFPNHWQRMNGIMRVTE